jgi:multidrug efflux pump subunit AcrB
MTGLIRWFLRSRVAANLLMVALLAGGIGAALSITVRTFPEIATNAITVSVTYPGATPTEVAEAVLTPIEQQLQGLEGVRELNAQARQDLGTVTAELFDGADPGAVKDDIETEVARIATFPDAARTPRISEREPVELAIQLALTGDVPAATLKALAERVREDLTDMPGISQVTLTGDATDQIDVAVRRQTLESYGQGLQSFADLISRGNVDLSGGQIDTGATDYQLRTLAEAETVAGLRDLVLFTGQSGAQVRLGEIADVRAGLADENLVSRISGQPAVFLSVNRAGREQVLDITEKVRSYLDDELRPRLPAGVEAFVWRNSGDELRGRIQLLAKNGAIGTGLILVLLMLFLDIRLAAWVAAGVVISFIGAFAPMLFFGVTVNQLSLFGFILALGIVVDDAIVVGENTYTELERARNKGAGAAERAALRVWRPIFFAVSTTILAFTPLLFLPGASGSFIKPVAAVVIFVLALSLVESFLVLPRHLSHVRLTPPRRFSPRRLSEPLRERVDAGLKRLVRGPVRGLVRSATLHPLFCVATALAIALGAAGLVAGGTVKFVFFPSIEGNFVTARLEMPDGTSEAQTLQRTRRISQAAREVGRDLGSDGLVQSTAVTIGFAPGAGGPGGEGRVRTGSSATITVKLRDADRRTLSTGRFKEAWRQAVGDVPGVRQLSFSAELVGVGAPILLEVAADSEEARDAAVGRMRRALSGREGVRDIRDDRVSAAREVVVTPTPAAQNYGVSRATLTGEIRAAVFGVTVEQVVRDREEVDIRVRLPESQRDSVADLLALDITTRQGPVPLPVLADVSFQPAPTTIERVDGRTVTTLTADVDSTLTSGGAETRWLMSQVVPQLQQDYPGLTVRTGGEQEEAGRFGAALAVNFALTLFGIYAVLSLAFGSYFRPLIVLGVVPFGFIGAILGHAGLGLNLTLLSMFGIVGLTGVVINDALLIVDFIQEREAEGHDPYEAVEKATLDRFRPVMLTTLTTFLGISPLILEQSVQAQFLVPTAVSLGFGILFASLLQMVLVPAYAALYVRVRDGRWRRMVA